MELLLPLPLRLDWPARDCRTSVTIVTVCQLLRASATLDFFLSRLPGSLPGHVDWDGSCSPFYYVQVQDLEINRITQGPVRRRIWGFYSFVRPFIPHVITYLLAIKSTCFPPLSLSLPSSSSQISIIVNATFCNDVSARPPLPPRITFCGHKPKYRYPRFRATCRWVSRSPLCSVRSWFCHGLERFAGVRAGKFRRLDHQWPPYLDSAE